MKSLDAEGRERAGVHILGCNLTVDGWDHLMWGTSEQWGRIPTGVLLAYASEAELISWGTGAYEQSGKKESQRALEHALDHVDTLAASARADPSQFRAWLTRVSITDEVTQNTEQEIRAFAELCTSRDIRRLVFVTSSFHMPRVMTVANILVSNEPFTHLRRNLTFCPSETSLPGVAPDDEVAIIERFHRGDMHMPPEDLVPHRLAKRMFALFKDPARLMAYLREWDELLRKYGV